MFKTWAGTGKATEGSSRRHWGEMWDIRHMEGEEDMRIWGYEDMRQMMTIAKGLYLIIDFWKNLHQIFLKQGRWGGVQRPFGESPEIHPICWRQATLRRIIIDSVRFNSARVMMRDWLLSSTHLYGSGTGDDVWPISQNSRIVHGAFLRCFTLDSTTACQSY